VEAIDEQEEGDNPEWPEGHASGQHQDAPYDPRYPDVAVIARRVSREVVASGRSGVAWKNSHYDKQQESDDDE